MIHHSVVIVGAGPAGIGLGAALRDFQIADALILDRHEIGASFRRWPVEMRLITPSFNSTPFGILDLNAVALQTSVANFLGSEHPTGAEYARYLEALAKACELRVKTPVPVSDVQPRDAGGFLLETSLGAITADFVIWAAGEFQSPRLDAFEGSELCLHTGRVRSFRELPGKERVVIGAFESGMDATIHLARRGVNVRLLNAAPDFAMTDQDPSRSLSPYTRSRMEAVCRESHNVRVAHNARVTTVTKDHGKYAIHLVEGAPVFTNQPPLMATGFCGSLGPVESLFDYRDSGEVLLSDDDESTLNRGLFLAGPIVRHEHHIFCYIYKFRQRFAVIAETIAERLNIPVADDLLELYKKNQMRLVDLSCCGAECVC